MLSVDLMMCDTGSQQLLSQFKCWAEQALLTSGRFGALRSLQVKGVPIQETLNVANHYFLQVSKK